jgi:hypothetical protein
MYERKHQKVLPAHLFVGRLAVSFGISAAIVLVALGAGTMGYRWVAHLPWIDALLNATMILTGMGPVSPLGSPMAKIFASAYALFSGVVFLSAIGIVMSPIFHRIMHIFHVEESFNKDQSD